MNKAGEIFKRHILLAGNTGFLGKSMEEKLQKEGWSVITLKEEDDSFTLYNPQIVLFFSGKDYMQNLAQVMQNALRHGAERFLYVTGCSQRQRAYEDFVVQWSRENGLQSSVIVLPESFGCGQPDDASVIVRLFRAVCRQERFQLHGRGDTCVPVLYSEDAAYAVVSIIQQKFMQERLYVVSEETLCFAQILQAMNDFGVFPQVDILGKGPEFAPETLAPAEGSYVLPLKPKFDVTKLLHTVYEAYAKEPAAGADEGVPAEGGSGQSRLEQLKPYLENIGLFALMVIISIFQGRTPVNSSTGLDICFLYIIVMGILYGKQQSLLAVVLSMGLLTWGIWSRQGDLASIFYVPEYIFHYSTYLFFGAFTGYIADNWKSRFDSLGYKLKAVGRRLSFLQRNYRTSIEIKDKLYHQIVNSDDSIGWLYNIIRELDSVEVEEIFTQAAAITGRIMGTDDVAIYSMGQGQFYLRQKVRLGEKTVNLPRSRKTEDNPYIMDMLARQHLFVNHGLQSGVPDLAAPIVYDGRVIAVIEIYGLDFEQWSIYQQNLLSVTARLISMAMGKAYLYEEGIQDRRFVPQTRILQPAEFDKLERGLKARSALQDNAKVVMMELDCAGTSLQELDHKLSGAIRQEDAVGLRDGKVFLLLYDVNDEGMLLVRQRLARRGIDVLESRELV